MRSICVASGPAQALPGDADPSGAGCARDDDQRDRLGGVPGTGGEPTRYSSSPAGSTADQAAACGRRRHRLLLGPSSTCSPRDPARDHVQRVPASARSRNRAARSPRDPLAVAFVVLAAAPAHARRRSPGPGRALAELPSRGCCALARQALVVFARPLRRHCLMLQLFSRGRSSRWPATGAARPGSAAPRRRHHRRRDPARGEPQRGPVRRLPPISASSRQRSARRARGYSVGAGAGVSVRHHPAGHRGRHGARPWRPALLGEGLHWQDIRPGGSRRRAGWLRRGARRTGAASASSAAPPSAHGRMRMQFLTAGVATTPVTAPVGRLDQLPVGRVSPSDVSSRGAASRTASSSGCPTPCSRIRLPFEEDRNSG